MMRPAWPASIVAALALGAPTFVQQVFRSGVEGVVVSVWVRDGKRPVPNLTARDFQLRDNGVYQALRDVSIETLPLDLTLTMDVSGSIERPQLEQIEHAERQLLRALRPTDRCRILTFTTRTVERAPMAAATPVLAPLKSGGGTALYDAAAQTLIAVPDPERRRFAIVMTDGGENSSVIDAPTLLEAAKSSDVVLDFVLPLPGLMQIPAETNWNLLARVAQATGGRMVRLAHSDLGQGFVDALEDFRVSYMLRYVPQGVKRGGWHEIKVDVVQPPDATRYSVRARTGYYGD